MSVTIPNSYKPREDKELLRCIENSDQIRVIEWDWVGEWKSYSIGLGRCDGAGGWDVLVLGGTGYSGAIRQEEGSEEGRDEEHREDGSWGGGRLRDRRACSCPEQGRHWKRDGSKGASRGMERTRVGWGGLASVSCMQKNFKIFKIVVKYIQHLPF